MTAIRSALVLLPQVQDDEQARGAFGIWLENAGWNSERQFLRPSPTHDTLGWKQCAIVNCNRPAWGEKSHGLCRGCLALWRRDRPDLETFYQQPRKRLEDYCHDRCSVVRDGRRCERFVVSKGLCKPHRQGASQQTAVSRSDQDTHPAG
jgi:hypothetical protein